MVAALLRVAWRKVMAAFRRVYDSRHLQADCQEPGSAPELYARQSSTGYLLAFSVTKDLQCSDAVGWAAGRASGL